jgi:hypothetical protein
MSLGTVRAGWWQGRELFHRHLAGPPSLGYEGRSRPFGCELDGNNDLASAAETGVGAPVGGMKDACFCAERPESLEERVSASDGRD